MTSMGITKNVVVETDGAENVIASYAYDNNNQPVSMTRNNDTYYYQYNAHGDVVSLTNSAGQIVNTYEYDPWGKVLSANETVVNSYRYAGYRYDSSIGLYYLQKRYYKPEIARFLTKDVYPGDLKNPQSLNPYAYVNNNPVNFVDPAGLFSLAPISRSLKITSAIAGTVAVGASLVPGGQGVALAATVVASIATVADMGITEYQYRAEKIARNDYLLSQTFSALSLLSVGAPKAIGLIDELAALRFAIFSPWRVFSYAGVAIDFAPKYTNKCKVGN